MYACLCRAITEADVRQAGHAGVTSPEDLIVLFGLNDPSCCGRCAQQPQRFVVLAAEGAAQWERGPATVLPSPPRVMARAAWALLHAAVRRPPNRARIHHREA